LAMGWLKRVRVGLANAARASELAQEVQTCQAEVVGLTRSVDALGEALVDQQRRNDQMLTEWATTLDKIGRWASRQSARERKDTNTKLEALGQDPKPNGAPTDVRSMTKQELRARVAQMRMGGTGVPSHDGQ